MKHATHLMRRLVKEWAVIVFMLLYVGAGMSPTVLAYLEKPAGRVYTGLHGFVDDYVGYTSYIEEGLYGRNTVVIRSLPKAGQTPTLVLYTYVAIGKIAGIAGWSAPFAYHAARAVLGALLVFGVYAFLRGLLRDRSVAICATVIAFLASGISWFVRVGDSWTVGRLTTFSYAFDSTFSRATTRHHYMLGTLLFLGVAWGLLNGSRIRRYRPAFLMGMVMAAFALGTVHPHFGTVMLITGGTLVLYRLVRRIHAESVPVTAGTLLALGAGLFLSLWGSRQIPFLTMFGSEHFARNEILPLPVVWNELAAFGPVLWLALPALAFRAVRDSAGRERNVFMLVWLIAQLACFLFLYRFVPTQRIRFVQSLYFVPMAYGTAVAIRAAGRRAGKFFLFAATAVLVALSFPGYVNDWRDAVWQATDYHQFPVFDFPTRDVRGAYAWLDAHTPPESTVMASYDAVNGMLLYTHNFVWGNTQGWPAAAGVAMEKDRDAFLSGSWPDDQARNYLRTHGIGYVFRGYQEATGFKTYPFLRPVYDEGGVTIYQVALQ